MGIFIVYILRGIFTDRKKIEQVTASIAVFLLAFITIGAILFTADMFFNWDIFPPDVEKVLGFLLLSTLVLIFSSVLINVIINVSIIAINTEELIKQDRKPYGKR